MKKILLVLILLTNVSFATTYGPPLIKKCSSCSGLIQEKTLTSGNTFGAKYWTDGKREAPMLPDSLWLVKCPHCGALVWIDELKEVGTKNLFRPDQKYKLSKPYIAPGFKDYFDALKQSNLTDKKKRYLRIHAWWAGNDKRRNNSSNNIPMREVEKENLMELFKLLSVKDSYIMKAEIQRELGEYDKAKEILSSSTNNQSKAATFIGDFVKQKNPYVLEIKYEEN